MCSTIQFNYSYSKHYLHLLSVTVLSEYQVQGWLYYATKQTWNVQEQTTENATCGSWEASGQQQLIIVYSSIYVCQK
jgi:hypothetical protein